MIFAFFNGQRYIFNITKKLLSFTIILINS